MMPEKYDLIVIGAGPGGHAAAEHAAKWGVRVAVIEKNQWGGTCTYKGCIPTKALLACTKQYANLKKLKRLGISWGEASVDFTAMKRHQKQMVSVSSLGVQKSLKESGVDLKPGQGEIIAPGEVEFTSSQGDTQRLHSDSIVIAWGSKPLLPSGIVSSGRIITSDEFLALETLPKSIVIVGGSVIGVEFATMLAELGVNVTLMELLDRIIPHEDEEAAALLHQELNRLGIAVYTSVNIRTIHETSHEVVVQGIHHAGPLALTADYALICTGRKPFLHTDELTRCGIVYNQHGIIVNENQMTTRESIYAVGDVTGGIMLAHRAMQQGRAVANYLYGDRSVPCRDDAVPSVVYSHPAVARVGLTERQARERGMDATIKRVEYAANIIARAELKGNGFVKAVFHKEILVGVTIVGDDAGDLIASMALAVANEMGRNELKKWIIPHPTLSEILHLL